MANRYWVGGTASWDGTAGTKWSDTSGGAGGQSVPTSTDDVFFDGSSGTGTVTIATDNTDAKSINCTGFTGTITGTADITVAGGITLVSGQTYTHTGIVTVTGTATITTASKTFSALTVNGSGITVTLGDALNTSTRNLIVTNGTFDTSVSNYSVTAGTVTLAGSSATINLNGSTITISGSESFSRTSGTLNAGTSQINITNTQPTFTGGIAGGGATFYNVSFTSALSAVNSSNIRGANTFNNLTFTNQSSSGQAIVIFDNNQTVNGTLTMPAGTNATCRTLFTSSDANAKTLTCAAVSLSDIDFRLITGAGAASWTGTRIGNATGNSGITFTASRTVYWNLASGGNWSATAWATTSGGTPSVNNFPLAQDTAIFESTGLNTGATVTFNSRFIIGTINLSARTFSPSATMTFATGGIDTLVVGDWINGTGSFLTGSTIATLTFGKIGGTQTVTGAGRAFPHRVTINAISGTLTLQDNVIFSANNSIWGPTVNFINGTLNLNGNTLELSGIGGHFKTSTGTKNITFNGGTLSLTNIIGTGNGFNNDAPTGFTTTAGTGIGTIKASGISGQGLEFVGGGSIYNCTLDQAGAGELQISGSNTFNNITNSYKSTGSTSIRFQANTTTTLNDFTASGEAGRVLTITSSSGSVSFTLSKSSGTVSVNYISISRSTATGGATWYAGANSTDGGNNTGWIFSGPPQPAFFLFF